MRAPPPPPSFSFALHLPHPHYCQGRQGEGRRGVLWEVRCTASASRPTQSPDQRTAADGRLHYDDGEEDDEPDCGWLAARSARPKLRIQSRPTTCLPMAWDRAPCRVLSTTKERIPGQPPYWCPLQTFMNVSIPSLERWG